MAVDRNFCASSYLAFRFIEKDDMDFSEGMHHQNIHPIPDTEKISVKTALEIDEAIKHTFSEIQDDKLGIMLSGGMDSAILASYMPGCDAYTFRFLGGEFQQKELNRATYYAKTYGLNLHYVDITWDDVIRFLPIVIKAKCAPVHSIEPQIYKAAIQAQNDGITRMVIGESSDLIFGGMDQLLARDWNFDDFVKRYTFTDPFAVLTEPVDMKYLYERYRYGDKIDFIGFMDDVFSVESASSYMNAFGCAQMLYTDPYAKLKMAEPLDLFRIRHGEPKYLIRELFQMKYADVPVPVKIPMPRPVDAYFANWNGPTRKEFKSNLRINQFSGNQKWQIWCLEQFFNFIDTQCEVEANK